MQPEIPVLDEEHNNCGTPDCCGECDTATAGKGTDEDD